MTDHAVFVPTSEGPMGGIVSEPAADARAGLILLPGYGRPARSGTNSFWTRLARELSEHGLVVLRVDYAREGETLPIGERGSGQIWRNDLDMSLFGQVLIWFRERLEGLDLFLAGACSGARGAIDLGGGDYVATVARTFLVVPYLRTLVEVGRSPGDRMDGVKSADSDAVDPLVVDRLRAILDRAPSWVLIGERDSPDVHSLERLLGPTAHELEVEVVPDLALHFLDQPDVQEQARRRLVDRIDRALNEREPSSLRSAL